LRLWPDAQPLVERLGRDFFLQLPEHPGVYLMRDRAGEVLYVGKAKNLRRRLGSYRTANPDRLPRRTLRLLARVARIEWTLCPDEGAALATERDLLRALRPPFNRAGTWPTPQRFLTWRFAGQCLDLAVCGSAESGWKCLGPAGRTVFLLQGALARLVWMAARPERRLTELPHGWFPNPPPAVSIDCGPAISTMSPALDELESGSASRFCDWVRSRLSVRLSPFERAAMDADLTAVAEAQGSVRGPGRTA
jgi:hypothetical protein